MQTMTELTGYMGFSFGEGRTDSTQYRGQLFNRELQMVFNGWKANCLYYSAQFDISKNLPAENVQTAALLKFFAEREVPVSNVTVRTEDDAEVGPPTRIISLQISLKDIERTRKAILDIDTACDGFVSRRIKAKEAKLQP